MDKEEKIELAYETNIKLISKEDFKNKTGEDFDLFWKENKREIISFISFIGKKKISEIVINKEKEKIFRMIANVMEDKIQIKKSDFYEILEYLRN